jgi:hypothetical protein
MEDEPKLRGKIFINTIRKILNTIKIMADLVF